MKRKILMITLLGLLLLGLCGCDSTPPEPLEPTPAPTVNKYGESGLYLVSAKVFDMPEGMDYLTYDPGFERERVSMLEAVAYSDAEAYAKAAPGEGAVIQWEFDAYSSKYKKEFAQSDFDVDAFCLSLVKSFTIGLEGVGESNFYVKPLYYSAGNADAETGEITGVIAYAVLGNKEILDEYVPKIYTSSKDFEIKGQDFDTSGLTNTDAGPYAKLRATLKEYDIETYTYFRATGSNNTGLALGFALSFEENLTAVLRSSAVSRAEDPQMLAARLILETDSFSLLAAELDKLVKGDMYYYPFSGFFEVAIYCLKEGMLVGNEDALAMIENQYKKLATASGEYALAELAHRLRLNEASPENYASFFPDVNEWGEKTLFTQSFVASLPEEMKSPLESIPLHIVMRNPSGIYTAEDFTLTQGGRVVPSDPMKGGFALLAKTTGHPISFMNKSNLGQYEDYYRSSNSTLFCPLDINNVQLIIDETFSYKNRGDYQVWGGGGIVAVYTYDWSVTVRDAITQEILYEDSIAGSSEESYTVPVGTEGFYVPSQFIRDKGIETLVSTLLEQGII